MYVCDHKGRFFNSVYYMKSRQQKEQEVSRGEKLAKQSKSLVFVDFSQTPVVLIEKLKTSLREMGSVLKVIKKTLLARIFASNKIEVDITQFEGQLGTIFADGDIVDVAGTIYRFTKEHDEDVTAFKMLAGYDVASATFYDAEKILEFGMLPSRDVLLAQLMSMFAAPMRALAIVLDQISQTKQEGAEVTEQDDQTEQEPASKKEDEEKPSEEETQEGTSETESEEDKKE